MTEPKTTVLESIIIETSNGRWRRTTTVGPPKGDALDQAVVAKTVENPDHTILGVAVNDQVVYAEVEPQLQRDESRE